MLWKKSRDAHDKKEDIVKRPPGTFYRVTGEKGKLLLSFSIAKRKKQRNKLFSCKGVSRLRTRPGLSALDLTAFEKAGETFNTAWVCAQLSFAHAPKLFCVSFLFRTSIIPKFGDVNTKRQYPYSWILPLWLPKLGPNQRPCG